MRYCITRCTRVSCSPCKRRSPSTISASCGWRWRAQTLATLLLVSLYRTPEAVEAAWKYFILCGVGIAQALFGTILLYFAAERDRQRRRGALMERHSCLGHELGADGTHPGVRVPAGRLRHQGGPGAATTIMPDAHSGPTPIRRFSAACCSTLRCTRWCA